MKSLTVFKQNKIFFIVISVVLFFYGCGRTNIELPLAKIRSALKDTPTYSIILEDMKEDGNFVKSYFHRYRIILQDNAQVTGWMKVPRDYYMANEQFLGMSLAAKKDGKLISSVAPPGYHYVGDSRYGSWRNDNRGGSFWEFYGKYALFSSLIGGWYRPIYRNDFNTYRQYRTRGAPYFGRNNEYGTSGSIVKQNKSSFYARRMARQRSQKASFKDSVARRTGRTRTGFRGRAGGFGK